MKKLFVIVCLILTQFVQAEVCTERSGQLFLGKAKNVQVYILDQYIPDYCTYQIEFLHYETAFYCALGAGEISHMNIRDESCSIKEGTELSGTLVLKGEQLTLE